MVPFRTVVRVEADRIRGLGPSDFRKRLFGGKVLSSGADFGAFSSRLVVEPALSDLAWWREKYCKRPNNPSTDGLAAILETPDP